MLLICGAAFNDEERARLEAAMETQFVDGPSSIAGLPEETRAKIRTLALKGHGALGGAEMDALPQLGLISNYGVGYDAIDVEAATPRNIRVTNTPGVLNDDVADLALAMMISFSRNMYRGEALVRSGGWGRGENFPLNRKFSGSSVGIVGLGRIGREIADRCAAFKCDVHYHSRAEKQTPGWTYHADLLSLASAVDYLVVALVGGKETENYVGADALAALGPSGVLINISRGTTIDEGAMLDALENGTIAGAGLDVFLNEPKIDQRFLALDNVVLQPHQGSGSVETRRAMAELQLANIQAFMQGQDLLTPVN